MAEDLGNITIRFGDGPGGGGGGGGDAGRQIAMAREAAKSALSGIMSNLPAFGRIVQAGTQGGGVAGVMGAARGAVSAAGGSMAAAGIAAILAPIGITAVAAVALKSMVGRVLDRVSELAAVSGPMAMQDAMNKLAEMRRDMREAQILGPMYQKVSELWRNIQDLFQPFILVIKQAFLSILVPILNGIAGLLKWLLEFVAEILKAIQVILVAIADLSATASAYFTEMARTAWVGGSVFEVLSGIYSGLEKFTRGAANGLNTVIGLLQQQTQSTNPNALMADTLTALSAPSLSTYRQRVRRAPVRSPGRPQGPTP